jgi:asparagine synthase (glutamine-hydrolysing)
MSGIAGIFHRDGRPQAPHVLERMVDVVSHRGPDGRGVWIDGAVGLAHLLLATTPEAVEERQPLVDLAWSLTVVFDGRIDDRSALWADLAGRGFEPRGPTDAHLVLAAYACWAEACFGRLLGDFALALWDGRRRRMVCARDVKGIKPFYYAASREHFVFGSELRQVFEHPAVPARPNEGMIAEYLAVAVTTQDETLYQDVNRLPPAHFLIVDATSLVLHRYWDVDPGRSIRYRLHQEYVDHFLEIFTSAVADRARCHGRLGVTLSGGLDSSAVVGVAQRLLRESGSKDRLLTFSHTFPGLPVDETPYIECVAREWGVESRLHPFGVEPAPWVDQARLTRDLPDSPFITASRSLLRDVAGTGARVLLSGVGSDAAIGGSLYPYPDLLRTFSWAPIAEEFRYQTRQFRRSYAAKLLLRSLMWPLLPASIRSRLELRRTRGERLALLARPFVERTELVARVHRSDCADRFRSLAKMETYRRSTLGLMAEGLETEDRANAQYCFEERHPFLDRRVTEFAMAVPDADLRRAGEGKLMLRRAPGLLPPSILAKQGGGEFSIWLKKTLSFPEVAAVFGSLAIGDAGWVDPAAVASSHRRMLDLFARGEPGHEAELLALWMVFAVEVWYRHGLSPAH